MRTLRNLLATWENWSAREVNRRALANATTERQREAMRDVLDQGDDVDPLDVLRDTAELVSLLSGWRWQVMRAARDADASWAQIGAAVGASAEQAETEYAEAVERQARHGLRPER